MRLGLSALMVFAGATALPLVAGITPLPSSLANSVDYINFTGPNTYPSSQLICVSVGCGGAFNPTFSATNAGTPVGTAYTATVWCVDYQLNVTTASQYLTNVVTLNNIGAPSSSSNVRYGNLDSEGTDPGWTYGLSGPGSVDTNSAAYRYTLAAALVSQYVGNPSQLAGNNEDLAIQQAIWYITSNTDYSNEDPAFTATYNYSSASTVDDFSYWVHYVETNSNNSVSGLNLNSWAVVSGPSEANGTLDPPTQANGYNSYQTFLVQITPEPTFYGVLAIGLIGLFAAARLRTRQQTKIESN